MVGWFSARRALIPGQSYGSGHTLCHLQEIKYGLGDSTEISGDLSLLSERPVLPLCRATHKA